MKNSHIVAIAVVVVYLITTTLGFAQSLPTVNWYELGAADGKKDAPRSFWPFGVLNTLVPGGFVLLYSIYWLNQSPPKVGKHKFMYLIGKHPDYITGYVESYRAQTRRNIIRNGIIGTAISTVAIVVLPSLLLQSQGE